MGKNPENPRFSWLLPECYIHESPPPVLNSTSASAAVVNSLFGFLTFPTCKSLVPCSHCSCPQNGYRTKSLKRTIETLYSRILPVVALGYNPVLQVIASPIVCICSNTLCISSLLLLAADGGATGGHPSVGNPGNPRVFFDITIGKQPAGRIVFEVFR